MGSGEKSVGENRMFFFPRFIKILYDKESFSLTQICSIPPMFAENIFHGSAVYLVLR